MIDLDPIDPIDPIDAFEPSALNIPVMSVPTTTVPTSGGFSLPSWVGQVTIPSSSIAGYYLEGTEAGDHIQGSDRADSIYGLGGDDVLYGRGGDDLMSGGNGNDQLNGGAGNDILYGDSGNDWLDGGGGADKLFGGDGWDTVSYAQSSFGVSIDVGVGGLNNDAQGDTYYSIENFVGSNLGDIMNGNAGDNSFDGGAGDDFLFGNLGADNLTGGLGADTLIGGHGNDVLIGGEGHDVLTGDGGDGLFGVDHFVFSANATSASSDTILDFQHLIDKLVFNGLDSTPFGADGKLATGHNLNNDPNLDFVINQLDVGDELFFNMTTHQLFRIDPIEIDGHVGLGNDPILLATFTNGSHVTAADFLFV
jgi:Ca2+-binding RTX toxin-like protein